LVHTPAYFFGPHPAARNERLRLPKTSMRRGLAMGEVIRFPDEAARLRGGRYVDASSEPATVIIILRVENVRCRPWIWLHQARCGRN
jgi:hypothetical protein